MKSAVRLLAGVLAAVACGSVGVASAAVPAAKLVTAPLVSPSTAWAYFGSATAHTNGAAAWGMTSAEAAAVAPPEVAVTKVVKPLGAQTDLVYDVYAGTDGGTLRLLGRKTEKVSASQNIVTAYAYDAANRYVLKSATVDPGGAASSTTCLQFDAVGNLIGTTDPRAAACP
jgi:hypothetical protein